MNKVCVKHLAQKFMWEIVCGDAESLDRPITLPDTNRPGLELAGYFPDSQTKRLVILGEKEMGYIDEETYKPYLLKAVDGIFNEFIRIDGDYAYLKNCCAVAGLGPDDNHRRDGSLDYYFSEPITENDCKGVGPFLLLATNYIY